MFRLALILLISSLTACSIGSGAPPRDHYYRLPDVTADKLPQPLYKSIVIKPVKASGLYHDRAMLYVEKEKPLELQRHYYHFWAQTPAKLIQNALYQGILASGVAQYVSRQEAEPHPDYIIDTRIVHFERVISGSNISVKVVLEIVLRNSNETGRHRDRKYQSVRTIQTTGIHPSAEAFGHALQEIVGLLIDDLINSG